MKGSVAGVAPPGGGVDKSHTLAACRYLRRLSQTKKIPGRR
jgi:hypothetical protein